MSTTSPGPSLDDIQPSRFVVYRKKLQIEAAKLKVWLGSHKKGRMLALQCAGAFSVLLGISQYSVPIALIIGGAGAIIVAERQ